MTQNLFIGTAGFSYPDWEGIVYPAELKQRKIHPLGYLARFFDLCEINTSFYGHLRPAVARNWCKTVASVNPAFQFSAKLFRAFTHAPAAGVQPTSATKLSPTLEDERLAREGIDALVAEGRLAALLIQFPVSFKNTDENRHYVWELLEKFRDYPRALEIRHDSWNRAEFFAQLAALEVGFCNIDQPRLGRSLGATQHTTAQLAYVRLHGRNYKEWFQSDNRDDRYNYLYTPKELESWKNKIEQMSQRAEKTLTVTNNHYKGKAAANAIELKTMLSGTKSRAPATLVKEYPELEQFAEVDPSL